MGEGDWNHRLFHAINGWPDGWRPFWEFFSQAFNYPWFKVLIGLLVIGMVVRGGRARRAGLTALLSVGLANWTTDQFKYFLPQHRPFQELKEFVLRAGYATSNGTASAHSANMAAIACAMTVGLDYWGAPWVAVALLTGISRIYVGVHYPSQVLLGWICGVLAGLLVTKTWNIVEGRLGSVKSKSLGEDAAT